MTTDSERGNGTNGTIGTENPVETPSRVYLESYRVVRFRSFRSFRNVLLSTNRIELSFANYTGKQSINHQLNRGTP